jgi:hypothetical protein
MMNKIMIIFFGIILSSSFCFAAETVTITTYYPAPYGVYNVLRLFPIAAPATCTEGELYFNSGSHNLFYCNNTPAWQAFGGSWILNGTSLYPNQTSWDVGIGTTSPQEKLEVAGRIYQSGLGNSTFLGYEAGRVDDLSANNNTGIGYQALYNNTAGANNTGIGYRALYTNNWTSGTNGSQNTAVGREALYFNTTGYNNTAMGYLTLYQNTTGYFNTGLGNAALASNITGYYNTAVGRSAIGTNTTGYRNTAVGSEALISNTTGRENTALGSETLNRNTVADFNTAMGSQALYSQTTGGSNTAVGYYALNSNASGTNNTAVGRSAGSGNTGSGNVFLGYQAGSASGATSNLLYIDNSSTPTPLIYGDFTNNRVGINRVATTLALEVGGEASKATAGQWVANSDIAIKTDVKDLENALAIIDKLRPVRFRYTEEYLKKYPYIKNHYYYNFIAQEFQKVFPDSVEKNAEGYLQMDSYPVTPYLVAAVQQLNKKIDELKEENKELKSKIEGLK